MTGDAFRLLFRARWATGATMRRYRVWSIRGTWR